MDIDLDEIQKEYDSDVAAYIYGYPLVLFGVTEQGSINSQSTASSATASLNQFGHQTEFPSSEFTGVVLPSTSTLYSSAFLNLEKEPIVLHLPDFKGRFFVMPMLDGWTNVNKNSPGTRNGSLEGDYVIVGPNDSRDYSGDGRTVIKMDTNSVWIIGRVFTSGTYKDLAYIKDEIYPNLTLTPWSKRCDKKYKPPSNLPFDPLVAKFVSPPTQVDQMNAVTYFTLLAAMMNYNQAPQDEIMNCALTEIGFNFGPPITFNWDESSPEAKIKKINLEAASIKAKAILDKKPSPDASTNFWSFATKAATGDFGRHYHYRASIARWALGANLVEDVVYGYALNDSADRVLSGEEYYELTFDPLPPVSPDAFWSVTVYNVDGTLVTNQNAINAGVDYNAIGIPSVQNHNAKLNSDGTITLYFQATAPKDPGKLQNWIPTPLVNGSKNDRSFIVFLRMYMPSLQKKRDGSFVIENGSYVVVDKAGRTWIPPGIELVSPT